MSGFILTVGLCIAFITLLLYMDTVSSYGNVEKKRYTPPFLISTFLIAWSLISCTLRDVDHVHTIKPVYPVDNTVCTTFNGKVVNLNDEIDRNFLPGDFVIIKNVPAGWFFGIYYEHDTEYFHWKEPPAGIGVKQNNIEALEKTDA